MKHAQNFWDNIWKDNHGKVVLWQSPNSLLYGWAIFAVIFHLLHSGNLKDLGLFISDAFLFVWAFLELTSGVDYFRRALGAVVLVSMIVSRL